ncbi:MAG: PhnD/SsuA/transferrin family substrate-binding protein [Cyanobacteria bacterium P01_A01_bin.3]
MSTVSGRTCPDRADAADYASPDASSLPGTPVPSQSSHRRSHLTHWAIVVPIVVAVAVSTLVACSPNQPPQRNRILIGTVAYGTGAVSLENLESFADYLAQQTQSTIEIEPAFNEVKALEQIRSRKWSLVFAPPGLAATAISTAQYIPLFPLQGSSNTVRSAIVVRNESPVEEISDLQGESLSLGQPGSATGYYLPLYDLFGLTLARIQVDATPRNTLAAVATGEVTAGALAKDEFERLESEFADTQFRVVHTSRSLPAGVVLVGPSVDRNLQEYIEQAMSEATPNLAAAAGYIPNANPPNYEFFIELIEKVSPYESRIYETPTSLYPATPDRPILDRPDPDRPSDE